LTLSYKKGRTERCPRYSATNLGSGGNVTKKKGGWKEREGTVLTILHCSEQFW